MSRTRLVLVVGVFVSCVVPSSVDAQEPDFMVILDSCKTAVGYMTQADDALKVLDGDLAVFACTRRSNKVMCVLSNIGETGPEDTKVVEFDVDLDSPPLLFLKTEAYSDFMMVNTTERTAVTITRVVHQQFAGAKVCHGLFATSSDLKAMQDD